MANRYLVASGSWTNPAIWSTTSGGVGGAGEPTASDVVDLDRNFTVTLNDNATCESVYLSKGSLFLSSYTLTLEHGPLYANGAAARTVNFGNGKLVINADDLGTYPASLVIDFGGSNLTIDAGSSTIEINIKENDSFDGHKTLNTGSTMFNDVCIRLGSASKSTTLNVTGSPTFRLLDIRSANSAAHTVNFDTLSYTKASKLIAIGSSSNNKLTLKAVNDIANIDISDSSYGQFIAISSLDVNEDTQSENDTPMYIGSNSTTTGSIGWLTQDPPKISTLVDPLTTAPGSNPNWTSSTYSGASLPAQTNTGVQGGGYRFSNKDTLYSTNTFDVVDEDIVVEIPPVAMSGDENGFALAIGFIRGDGAIEYGFGLYELYLGVELHVDRVNKELGSGYVNILSAGGGSTSGGSTSIPTSLPNYVRFSLKDSTGLMTISRSTDGNTWSSFGSATFDSYARSLLRSSKIVMSSTPSGSKSNATDIGSINPTLGPTVPTASFTGSPTTGRAPLAVSFADTSAGIPDTWLWNFGDGTYSSGQNPSHTYSATGTYNVSLTASNSLGSDSEIKNAYISAEETLVTGYGGIATGAAFGAFEVAAGAVTISGGGIASGAAFGSYNVLLAISGGSVPSSASFGSNWTIITGNKTVSGGSIDSSIAFGDDWTVIRLGVVISGGSAHDGPSFGDYSVVPGGVVVAGYGGTASNLAIGDSWEVAQSAPPPPPPTDWEAVGKEDEKEFIYKVYDRDGDFIGVWTVKDEPEFTQRLGTPGTTMTVLLPRSADAVKEVREQLQAEDGRPLETEDGRPLTATLQTANAIGPGTDVDLGYRVDIFAHYGYFEQLQAEDGRPLETEDGRPLEAALGAPLGVRIFSGFILDYDATYATKDGVVVTLASHGYRLSEQLIRSGEVTTVNYNSQPIETTLASVLDTNPGVMTHDNGTLDSTGVSVPAKFQLNTKLEGIQHLHDQAPAGFYWYGNVAENKVYLKQASSAADHTFIRGKHIKEVHVERTIEGLVNEVHFVGGEISPGNFLYKKYVDVASQAMWGVGLHRKTDRRYTLAASTQRYADKIMGERSSPIYTTTLSISSARYNIELIKLGQMVRLANNGNYIDDLLLQIVSLGYAPYEVKMQLGGHLPTTQDTLSSVESSLDNEQFETIPAQPS
ncbi:MAG: PKD domain-containing protein [Ornithinimicrobium sp.]